MVLPRKEFDWIHRKRFPVFVVFFSRKTKNSNIILEEDDVAIPLECFSSLCLSIYHFSSRVSLCEEWHWRGGVGRGDARMQVQDLLSSFSVYHWDEKKSESVLRESLETTGIALLKVDLIENKHGMAGLVGCEGRRG